MKRNYYMVGLVFLTFFVISLITNILGPLIPDIIDSFNLSLTLVALLPFSFFIAYGVMSIPSSMLIETYKEKPIMFISFIITFLGAFTFALIHTYIVAIFSLFVIGISFAMLQVAINPLLRVSGGEEHFAFNSVMAQLIFGAASFISPRVYSYLVQNIDKHSVDVNIILASLSMVVPKNLPWISLYWVFTFIALLMIIVIAVSKFPKVFRTADERVGAWKTHVELFKSPMVILYFFGIFCYVGSEQGVANWMSQFLNTYHNYDPQVVGANAVSWFWGLMTAGCLLGLLMLKLFDSRRVLIVFTSAAILSLTVAIFGPGWIALVAFPLIGFFASVMWSIVFSLALNSMVKCHGSFSGILCTGIAGGAIISLLIGWLGDQLGLRVGMVFLYLTFGYILSIGFWAKPIITNKTIKLRKKQAAEVLEH